MNGWKSVRSGDKSYFEVLLMLR